MTDKTEMSETNFEPAETFVAVVETERHFFKVVSVVKTEALNSRLVDENIQFILRLNIY